MAVPACVARSRTLRASLIFRNMFLKNSIFRNKTARNSCNPSPATMALHGTCLRDSLRAQAIASRPAMPRSACSASGTEAGVDGLLDRERRGARVSGVADRAADHDVVGAAGEGPHPVGGALLVAGRGPRRADAGGHHQQLFPVGGLDLRGLERRG